MRTSVQTPGTQTDSTIDVLALAQEYSGNPLLHVTVLDQILLAGSAIAVAPANIDRGIQIGIATGCLISFRDGRVPEKDASEIATRLEPLSVSIRALGASETETLAGLIDVVVAKCRIIGRALLRKQAAKDGGTAGDDLVEK